MAFDEQTWNDDLKQVEKSLTGGNEEAALDNVKNAFEQMSPDERNQALQKMMEFNNESGRGTAISLDHSPSGGEKFAADNVSESRIKLFGQNHMESE